MFCFFTDVGQSYDFNIQSGIASPAPDVSLGSCNIPRERKRTLTPLARHGVTSVHVCLFSLLLLPVAFGISTYFGSLLLRKQINSNLTLPLMKSLTLEPLFGRVTEELFDRLFLSTV